MSVSRWWQRLETIIAAAPTWLWLVLGIITTAVLAGAIWWWVPKWQMKSITASSPKDRADIEDNFRKTVGQALGGIAVLIGAGFAYFQFTQQQNQFTQQQNAAHDLLISNQVAKGFEQLGSPVLVVRLGGIYSLEAVMNGSPQYHQPVLEALCAFVRNSTIGIEINDKDAPATDIQAALTVIGRRNPGPGAVNLARVNIPNADLSGLTGGPLADFILAVSVLGSTFWSGARLSNADLSGANLTRVNLTGADLSDANLTRAGLSGAGLIGANLSSAYLIGANLGGADLTRADLTFARLSDADLSDTNLTHANLGGADLSATKNLIQEQLDPACGNAGTKLPKGLTLKPCSQPSQSNP